jgi:hydrogenase maturation factor
MVIAVPQAEAHEVVDLLAANDRRARIIGELVDGTGVVHLRQ